MPVSDSQDSSRRRNRKSEEIRPRTERVFEATNSNNNSGRLAEIETALWAGCYNLDPVCRDLLGRASKVE